MNGSARAARLEARRLRNESQELKLTVRSNLARSQVRLGRAQVEAEWIRARRGEALPSPWSELRWTQTDENLERTLVPVP